LKRISQPETDELEKHIGQGRVLALPSDRALYSHDLGNIPTYLKGTLFRSLPAWVVQPASEEELVEVLRFCRNRRVPVITRTAASSGFGNVIPTQSEGVIDLGCLNRIVRFDSTAPSVTVEAGARWADVDAFLNEKGLTLHTYPSSYYSSVGGWVATGGLGINSLRFGHLKNHVLTLRVIFPEGETRDLSPSDPWFDRFFGTEGQLGVISQVTLKARQQPQGCYPLGLFFEGEDEAFRWMVTTMAAESGCTHMKFIGPHLIDEMNRFFGESLIDPQPTILAVFDEADRRDRLTTTPGRKTPDYLARFLWRERLFPLRMSRVGSSLLASETLFEDDGAAGYVGAARRLAKRLGFDVVIEAHAVGPHRILVMPHMLAEPTRPLHYGMALALTSLLTQLAVDQGGVPYGLGIWNTPFIESRFDGGVLKDLQRWKDEVDPDRLLNPRRFFLMGTRFFNIPGVVFRPWIFQPLMRALMRTAPLWGWLARLVTSGRREPSGELTPMERTALLCSRCGSCLSVCPAYRVTRDEAVTARSKLRTIEKLSKGASLSREEVEKVFLCLHCRACERVCQSRLKLVEAWEALEKDLTEKHGTPSEAVARFMNNVSESDEYQQMVDNW
jgi:FAD/FMN-containing dehydrogenase/ferredoxin